MVDKKKEKEVSEKEKKVREEVARFLKAGFMRFWNDQFKKTGSPPDQRDYAEWLEVSPPSLSRWMQMRGVPNDTQKQAIARRLGVGIYKAAGTTMLLPDTPEIQEMVTDWFDLSEEDRQEVLNLMRTLVAKSESKGFMPDADPS